MPFVRPSEAAESPEAAAVVVGQDSGISERGGDSDAVSDRGKTAKHTIALIGAVRRSCTDLPARAEKGGLLPTYAVSLLHVIGRLRASESMV